MSKQMSQQAMQHSFFTVNNLMHVQTSQFAKLAYAYRIAL